MTTEPIVSSPVKILSIPDISETPRPILEPSGKASSETADPLTSILGAPLTGSKGISKIVSISGMLSSSSMKGVMSSSMNSSKERAVGGNKSVKSTPGPIEPKSNGCADPPPLKVTDEMSSGPTSGLSSITSPSKTESGTSTPSII